MVQDHEVAADVVVVGGGISGLAAARAVHQAGYTAIVLERGDRVGGRMRTEIVDGVPIDLGAQFINGFYDATIALIDEVGLSPELAQRSQRAYLVDRGVVQGLWPAGELMSGHALSAVSKGRMLLLTAPLVAHWRQLSIVDLASSAALDRESAAQFLGRLTGKQTLDNFFAPLLRGLLYWDADTTGIAIVLAILKSFVKSRSGTYRMDGGIDQLPHALTTGIHAQTSSGVRKVTQADDGYLVTADGPDGEQQIAARGVLCATTATQVNAMMPWLPRAMASFFGSVSYTRTAILTFRVASDAKNYPRGALLFPVPAVKDIASINPRYEVVDGAPGQAAAAADDSGRLINVFLSDQGIADYDGLDDKELAAVTLKRVSELIGSNGWASAAELVHVHRWPEALPRYQPGHIEAVRQFRMAEAGLTGLAFAGDYLDGPYIDGAVRSGQSAARRLISWLGRPAS
jgi:oxygen-dependent protoporphyrinogen oxidase